MAPHREGALLAEARARGREEGPQGPGGLGERLPAHHQQQAADQDAGRPRRASSCACPEGKWRVKMFQAYGANPSPMKFSEVFTALQTGVMDGAGESVHADLLGEAAGGAEVPVAVRPRLHAGLPDRRQDQWDSLPRRRAQGPRGHGEGDAGLRLRRTRAKDDDDLLGKLKAAGMQVNDVDKDAFVAASKPIYEEFGKEVRGREGSDRPRRRARASRPHGGRDGRAAAGAPRSGALARFRARYGRVLEWVVIVLMVALAVEVTAGVVFRYVGRSLVWYDEVASVLLAWLTFYGVGARVGQARAHRLPGARRRCCRGRARRGRDIVAAGRRDRVLRAARLGRRRRSCRCCRRHAGEPAVGADERRAVGDPDLVGADHRRRGHASGRPASARRAAARPAGATLADGAALTRARR